MTDYCTVDDVKAKFKNLPTSSTTEITTADIEDFITVHSAYIDGALAGVYVTPVTGTEALKILKQICTLYVAAEVDEINRRGSAEKDQDLSMPRDYRARADRMLNDIKQGSLVLSDATDSGADRISSYNETNSVEFTVRKGCRQW